MQEKLAKHLLITTIVLLSMIFPSYAYAWRAVIVDPNLQGVDIGSKEGQSAAFLRLDKVSNAATVSVSIKNAPETLELYVPNQIPENKLKDNPTFSTLGVKAEPDYSHKKQEDPVTGLSFIRIATLQLDENKEYEVKVVAGKKPTRAVVMFATPKKNFSLQDAQKYPRTVAKLRYWYDNPADPKTKVVTQKKSGKLAPISALIVSVLTLLIGAWWILSGKEHAYKSSNKDNKDS